MTPAQLWKKLLEHPAWAGISGIVGIVALVFLFSSGTEELPRPEPPDTLLEQIEQSDI
jgi:hypothetical protein